jgi:hypothetical protein
VEKYLKREMKKTIKKVLEDWAEDTKSEIVNKIISKGAVDTGRLRDSIGFEVKEESDTYKVYFEMVDYGKFVDEGTIYIRPREFFNKVIEENVNNLEDELEDDIVKYIEKKLTRK